MRRFVPLLLAGSLALHGQPASAAEERSAAREIFDAAQKLFVSKNFRAAALAFESAAEKEPAGGAHYAAGVSWHEAGEPARAADNLTRALGFDDLDAHMQKDAQARLETLKRSVGRIRVNAPRGTRVSVAHVQSATPPVELFAAPADQLVKVVWPSGYASSHLVSVTAGQRVDLDLSERDEPRGWETEAARTQRVERAPESDLPIWGWVAVGAGGALALAGGVLLANGVSARDDFRESGRTDQDARDRAVSLRTWGNVLLIGGVVCAAGGLTLVVMAPDEPHSARAELRVTPRAVELSARF